MVREYYIIIIFLLIQLALGYIVAQSDLNQYIISTNPPQLPVQSINSCNPVNPKAPNNKNIWNINCISDQSRSQGGADMIKVQNSFKLICNGPLTLYVAADDQFIVYVNDILIGSASSTCKYSTYTIPLQILKLCEKNVLTIIGKNGLSGSYQQCWWGSLAAMNYALYQDTSTCFNCLDLQTYNVQTCKCQSIDYVQTIYCESVQCSCNKIQILLQEFCQRGSGCECSEQQYYNERACKCQCIPNICNNGFKFDNNLCSCVKI